MADNLLYLGYRTGMFVMYNSYRYDSDGGIASYYADLEPNTTYTIKNWDGSSRWRLGLFTDDIVNMLPRAESYSITNYWDGDNPLTFTTGANNTHMVIYYTNSGEYSTRVMLNEGSTAEAYTAPTVRLPHGGLWYMTDDDTRFTHDDLPDGRDSILVPPYPPGVWQVDNDILTHYSLKPTYPSGAFCNCSELRTAIIPSTVTYIGPYAFYGTALRKVVLPRGCTYFDTSFPRGCIVETTE